MPPALLELETDSFSFMEWEKAWPKGQVSEQCFPID
jgi:hypothetical protein